MSSEEVVMMIVFLIVIGMGMGVIPLLLLYFCNWKIR